MSLEALTSAIAGCPAGVTRRPLTTMRFELLIEIPESMVDGRPTSRMGVFGVRSTS